MENNNHQFSQLNRVVITGIGAITPLGHNAADSWQAALRGTSGVNKITLADAETSGIDITCEVKDFVVTDYLSKKEARRQDRYQHFATIAAREAIQHANLTISPDSAYRTGVYMGIGIGGISTLVEQESILHQYGERRLNPFGVTMIMPNGAAGLLSIEHGLEGPSITIATACASSSDAIGYAYRSIRYGEIDTAVAGGSDAVITAITMRGFKLARAASNRTCCTPSPFDKNRDGLVIGEGAGVLILESLDHARARNANILAEIIGYGHSNDAFHITAPAIEGRGATRAIKLAMEQARITPEDIDYINAHGTGTLLNDSHETMAIKNALGETAYQIPTSSTKSMTGHIMGATAAIEAIFCTQALQDQILPPTINYETADPECDLDYIPNTARKAEINIAMSNAFGFGGHNSVLLFKRFSPS